MCKFGMVSPEERGVYDWRTCDGIFDVARQMGWAVRGHVLVWHLNLPKWFGFIEDHREVEKVMQQHISAVTGRYPGAYAWDVVNEAISNDYLHVEQRLRTDSMWFESLGPTYIEKAFFYARESCSPETLLFMNDFAVASMTGPYGLKSQHFYDVLADLKRRQVPVDGAGLQLHIGTNYAWVAGVAANMERLAALGLHVHMTEVDVRVPEGQPWSFEEETKQAEVYAALLQACLSQPACTSFVVWGFDDRRSWHK